MANLDIHKAHFVKKWKDQNKAIIMSMHPDVREKDINKFLDKIVDDNISVPTGEIHNNYNHKRQKLNLLQLVDWYHKKKPIIAGYGCLFMDQSLEPNPAAKMQDNFMQLRKFYKNRMYEYPEGSYEYGTFNRMQNNEKIGVNSFRRRPYIVIYGCSSL
jgi:hypothetical protein